MSDHDKSAHLDLHAGTGGSALRYVPYFLVVLALYIILKASPADLHEPFFKGTNFAFSWSDVLLILSAILAMAEQMKVSHPGIDNTWEALVMVGMGVVQLVLFVLGVAKVPHFEIFANVVFVIITIISMAAAIVAILINARTLRRTIGVGDN
ncbi:MAG: hypothetical protein P4L57_02010 [Rhizomicrobium sp.]|nr:hypothetical protein [Rhizomicrobium sp.]